MPAVAGDMGDNAWMTGRDRSQMGFRGARGRVDERGRVLRLGVGARDSAAGRSGDSRGGVSDERRGDTGADPGDRPG